MIKSLLESYNIEPTLARIAVYRILKEANKPLDTTCIINKLKEELIEANRVTVFRIINLFVEKRLVQKMEFAEGKARYELASLPHHHHVICTSCGSIKDFELCNVEVIERKLEKDLKFHVNNHRIDFFGTCIRCS